MGNKRNKVKKQVNLRSQRKKARNMCISNAKKKSNGNKENIQINTDQMPSNDDMNLEETHLHELQNMGLDEMPSNDDINSEETHLHELQNIGLDGVWSGCNKQIKVEIIQRDDQYWKQNIEKKVTQFYETFMLPELCDPRHVRNMPIRDLDECN